jgi:hypothetical protein
MIKGLDVSVAETFLNFTCEKDNSLSFFEVGTSGWEWTTDTSFRCAFCDEGIWF